MSDANDWEWVRVLAQGRVYDDNRPTTNRLAWAAIALAASHGGERNGIRRTRALADRFALKARLIRSLGPWTTDPDNLVTEVLAETEIPTRHQKLVAQAIQPVIHHIKNDDLRHQATHWLTTRTPPPTTPTH
ncbi:hypothetical protein [Saccharothrix sp. HUAS TT1]|uniref:hypothetical protein n=1 Tax=unclassified Saccharothrix TaxID=2593673 RepID=UPI00345C4143